MEDNNKERRELAMLKQNSEGYEDNVFRAAKETYMRPLSRVENFFYYFKWILLIGGLAAALVIFMVIQMTSREPEDIRVVLVSYDHLFAEYEKPLEDILGQYCADVDGDGETNAEVITVDMMTRDIGSQYDIAENEKLTTELRRGVVQMVISDEEFYEFANTGSDAQNVFVDLSDEFPAEMLYMSCGVRACMVLTDAGLPENMIIYVRAELPDFNNSKSAADNRALALDVLRAMKNNV